MKKTKKLILLFLMLVLTNLCLAQTTSEYFRERGLKTIAILAHPTNTFNSGEVNVYGADVNVLINYENGYQTTLQLVKSGGFFISINVLDDNDFIPPFFAIRKLKDLIMEQSQTEEQKENLNAFENKINKYLSEMNGNDLACFILTLDWFDYFNSSSRGSSSANPDISESIIELKESSAEDGFMTYKPCSFSIDLLESFKLENLNGESSPDYCDFEVKLNDGFVIMELHSLLSSRFELNTIIELYNVAVSDSELEITYKTQNKNWFVISGINKENGNIVYWKRVLGNKFVSDLHIEYPPERKSQIEQHIGRIAKSFISD